MQTLEQQLKKELGLPNYRKEVFNIEFADHVESEGTCFIYLNTGNKEQDVITLQRIEKHLKSETKQVLYLVPISSSFDDDCWGDKKYDGSQLVLKLK